MPKLLIVEDEPGYQQILRHTFTKKRYQVSVVSQARNVIFQTIKTNPDLILLDIMLPGGMNGFDLLEQLKHDERTKHIPVIILTNIGSEEVVAKKIGASQYFVKSETSLAEIIQKVQELLFMK